MNNLTVAAELDRINNPQQLWDRVLAAFKDIGFEFCIYLSANDQLTQVQVLTNIPEIYADTDPLRDPFLHYCCKSYQTTLTGPEYLKDYGYLPAEAQDFITRSSRTGFIAGAGVPTRIEGAPRFGGFNLGTRLIADAFEAAFMPKMDDVRLLCMLAHRRLEEVFPAVSEHMSRLSPRERDVITLIAQGRSRKDCARLLELSPNTVADYTKSAYRKLGVGNRAEAARLLKL